MSPFQCAQADDITINNAPFQRETGVEEVISHWSSHLFNALKLMILVQRMLFSNERLTFEMGSLTGQVTFSLYQS
jgi:hypothetical protein